MRSFTFFLLVTLGFTSCNPPPPTPNAIFGTYELTETLFDPGDGSGEFQAIDSNLTITIRTDSTFTSNGALCEYTTDGLSRSRGTLVGARQVMQVSNCYNNLIQPDQELGYAWDELEFVVSLGCDEPCLLRFEKVSD
ncbi:MAG TPA: hypothetical protein DCE41_37140 [Cytophagales bacterium]|nr:hypothetical protein [Cytophagales bacterium]HAA22816.1 hypothetical protein [Cytophagales bacterium]HAP65309.1 hypothetical protein [Cytophagales bacterium]